MGADLADLGDLQFWLFPAEKLDGCSSFTHGGTCAARALAGSLGGASPGGGAAVVTRDVTAPPPPPSFEDAEFPALGSAASRKGAPLNMDNKAVPPALGAADFPSLGTLRGEARVASVVASSSAFPWLPAGPTPCLACTPRLTCKECFQLTAVLRKGRARQKSLGAYDKRRRTASPPTPPPQGRAARTDECCNTSVLAMPSTPLQDAALLRARTIERAEAAARCEGARPPTQRAEPRAKQQRIALDTAWEDVQLTERALLSAMDAAGWRLSRERKHVVYERKHGCRRQVIVLSSSPSRNCLLKRKCDLARQGWTDAALLDEQHSD